MCVDVCDRVCVGVCVCVWGCVLACPTHHLCWCDDAIRTIKLTAESHPANVVSVLTNRGKCL